MNYLSSLRTLGYGLIALLTLPFATAQTAKPSRESWVDSMYRSLSEEERIAQLMVVRASSEDNKGNPIYYFEKVEDLVKRYNIGGVCLFQGRPEVHAAALTKLQAMAKVPLMVTVDGEWGLGMRFAGVQSFPYQLTLGALPDTDLVYEVGKAIGDQCRRAGIHVNYAPVVDINNNPANPVIGVRSFGEDKFKVGAMGVRIMQGMQDRQVMACAKHFPGHGDVSVDSHFDLPVINKSRAALDALELYPFREVFARGIGSVMVGHLYIPAIDATPNRAASLSHDNVTRLLRTELGYNGLAFTDALGMKGVAKFFPTGEVSVLSLMAGNDMLCLPADVPEGIRAVLAAIRDGRLTWEKIEEKCRRVLAAKYDYVREHSGPVSTENLLGDLNRAVPALRKAVAEKALTVLRKEKTFAPLSQDGTATCAYVQIGGKQGNEIAAALSKAGAKTYYAALGANDAELETLAKSIAAGQHRRLIVGVHGLGRKPSTNFGVSESVRLFVGKIGGAANSTLLVFGNPYALKNFESAPFGTMVVCYEDDAIFQKAALDWLNGRFSAVGTLPVTVGQIAFGTGVK